MMRSTIFVYSYAIALRITIHLIYIGLYYINFFQQFFRRSKERNRKRGKGILQDELKKIKYNKNLDIILWIEPYVEYIISKITVNKLFNFLTQNMVILLLYVSRLRCFWFFYQEFVTLVFGQWICMHSVFLEWWKIILCNVSNRAIKIYRSLSYLHVVVPH